MVTFQARGGGRASRLLPLHQRPSPQSLSLHRGKDAPSARRRRATRLARETVPRGGLAGWHGRRWQPQRRLRSPQRWWRSQPLRRVRPGLWLTPWFFVRGTAVAEIIHRFRTGVQPIAMGSPSPWKWTRLPGPPWGAANRRPGAQSSKSRTWAGAGRSAWPCGRCTR